MANLNRKFVAVLMLAGFVTGCASSVKVVKNPGEGYGRPVLPAQALPPGDPGRPDRPPCEHEARIPARLQRRVLGTRQGQGLGRPQGRLEPGRREHEGSPGLAARAPREDRSGFAPAQRRRRGDERADRLLRVGLSPRAATGKFLKGWRYIGLTTLGGGQAGFCRENSHNPELQGWPQRLHRRPALRPGLLQRCDDLPPARRDRQQPALPDVRQPHRCRRATPIHPGQGRVRHGGPAAEDGDGNGPAGRPAAPSPARPRTRSRSRPSRSPPPRAPAATPACSARPPRPSRSARSADRPPLARRSIEPRGPGSPTIGDPGLLPFRKSGLRFRNPRSSQGGPTPRNTPRRDDATMRFGAESDI